MNHKDHLARYLRLCQRIYERMQDDGNWPWAPGQQGDLEDNQDDT